VGEGEGYADVEEKLWISVDLSILCEQILENCSQDIFRTFLTFSQKKKNEKISILWKQNFSFAHAKFIIHTNIYMLIHKQ
jgi:hypothetical protein